MKGAHIRSIASVFGSIEISSQEISNHTGSPADFRKDKLGIERIRVAAEHETPSSMGTQAINKLLEKEGVNPSSIQFLICVTQNPDHLLPTTACIIQHKAKLPNSILAYDVNLGCSGYVFALAQAKALIASGMAQRGIVLTTDVYNRIINKTDRNTFGLFGDAAAATLVESCAPEVGIGNFFFGSEGEGANALIVKNGGSAFPNKTGAADDFLHMDGKSIYKFVVRLLPSAIQNFMRQENKSNEDIDHWIFHQANKHMNSELCKILEIPPNKAYFNISDIGNTVSATIPIALERAQSEKLICGNRIVLCGFGVGLSWGGCMYSLRNDGL